MPSRDRMELLRSFLGSLPVGLAGKVARAVELDRINQGKILPHDLILDSLRPTLRGGDKPARAPTPLRLFCQPFEDLLINEQWGIKQRGRIPRSSITPVWNWLSQELAPEAASAFAIAVKTAVLTHALGELRGRAEEFWKRAGAALRAKLGADGDSKGARQALGSDELVGDAHEMALMLSAGSEICALQDSIPHVLAALTDEVVDAYRNACEQARRTAPETLPYLPLVVMRRLEQPWEALRLPVDHSSGMGEAAPGDSGLAAEVLFNAAEAHAAGILAAQPERFNADALTGHVAGFTRLSSGMAKEIEMRRDGAWGQRLLKDRAAVAEALDRFMTLAPLGVAEALPLRGAEERERAHLPDMSQPADPEKGDRALSFARLLAGCRTLAGEGSFGASLKRADAEITARLKRYNEEIVRALRVTDEETRLNAEQYAALATELTAILLNPDEGETVRQQGRAALVDAA